MYDGVDFNRQDGGLVTCVNSTFRDAKALFKTGIVSIWKFYTMNSMKETGKIKKITSFLIKEKKWWGAQ